MSVLELERPPSHRQQPEPSIQEESIAGMESSLTTILEQITQDGKNYDLIVGDDTSGRLPTLVVAKVLNSINTTKSPSAIPVRFVGGGRFRSTYIATELNEIIRRRKELPGRVLLVTDYIYSGWTISRFREIFTGLGIKYDVAALTIWKTENYLRETGRIAQDTTLYFGTEESEPPDIHGKPSITGLDREQPLSSRAIKQWAYDPDEGRKTKVYADKSWKGLRSKVITARRDVEKLASGLADQLLATRKAA